VIVYPTLLQRKIHKLTDWRSYPPLSSLSIFTVSIYYKFVCFSQVNKVLVTFSYFIHLFTFSVYRSTVINW
jgi:hypothetical protein